MQQEKESRGRPGQAGGLNVTNVTSELPGGRREQRDSCGERWPRVAEVSSWGRGFVSLSIFFSQKNALTASGCLFLNYLLGESCFRLITIL